MQFKYLWLLLGFWVLCSTTVIGQLPCSTQLDIISENTDGDTTPVICNNRPLTLYASITQSDCASCSYQWNTGSTNVYQFAFTPATYTVTVTDNSPGGCTWVSAPFVVTATTLAVPILSQDSINICVGQRDGVGFQNDAVLEISNVCTQCTYEFYENTVPLGAPVHTTVGNPYYDQISTAGEYFVRVTDPSSPVCQEDSRVATIDVRSVSVPPALATTYSLCDTNTALLSTNNCSGCSYQWQFYDYAPAGKLVITGVFDATRPGGKPTGVELYAIGQIPDLSQYTIRRAVDGLAADPVDNFTFPALSLSAGSFIYITDQSIEFNNFFGFFADYFVPNIAIDGNDAIELLYNGNLVDIFGGTPPATGGVFPPAWAYADGWNYRKPQVDPSNTFVPSDWERGANNFRIDNRNNAFWGSDEMPIETYTAPNIPNTELVLTSVFANAAGSGQARGIELKSISPIMDLADYKVNIFQNGGPTLQVVFTSRTLRRGRYMYLTDDLDSLNSFLGISTNVELNTVLSDLDGLDAVVLYKDHVPVDMYGDTTFATPINWDFNTGWAKTTDNRVPSLSFDVLEWNINPGAWSSCNPNINCAPSLTLGSTNLEEYPSKLIVTGVFDNNRGAVTESRGIELYAIADIPDIGVYTVELTLAGAGSATTISLPGGRALTKGQYFYLVNDLTSFNAVYSVGNPSNIEQRPVLNNLDGNDVVTIVQLTDIVDAFGDNLAIGGIGAGDYSVSWSYQDGWIYRLNNSGINTTTYDPSDWLTGKHNYRPKNQSFGADRMPINSYVNNTPGTRQNNIPNTDSFLYRTNRIGDYIVEVTFPSGCKVNSDTIAIDTAIFIPQIMGIMPNSGRNASGVDTSGTDNISYLCTGSFVELTIKRPFQAPPNWRYQWSRNGIDIAGETGYNYTTTLPGRYQVYVINDDGCTSYSNIIQVLNSTNGANPGIAASSLFLCPSNAGSTSTLTTASCSGCSYVWRKESGVLASALTGNEYTVTNGDAGGYYVEVTDQSSGCKYQSPIVVVSDTTYPSPLLTTSGNTVCSETPINISTTPCPGCAYNWQIDRDNGAGFTSLATTRQAIERVNISGKYRLTITYDNDCQSNVSNTLQVTFETVNANLLVPAVTSICNGDPVILQAIPDSASAPALDSFRYVFLRDGIPMQKTEPADQQAINSAGDYQVVVTNIHNCADTSSAITFEEININTNIRPSANKMCGPTADVVMEIDSCDGCAYQWYLGSTSLITQRDTFYQATGYAAADSIEYIVEVSKAGCVVSDTFLLDSVVERNIVIELDSTLSTFPTMCDGSTVQLQDGTCDSCNLNNGYYRYQWYIDGNPISGAQFEGHLVDTPGVYFAYSIDTNGCEAISNSITVQEFVPDPNLALDFSALGAAVPITYGKFDLNDHLQPVSLRNQGTYTSLTAQAAIDAVTDTITVSVAGSGYHFITFTYEESNSLGTCEFSTYDTLYVLGAVSMDIVNSNSSVPPTEACISDVLDITLTNFTFEPTEVRFVTSNGGYIPVAVTPVLTNFAGVFSGTFQVTVPDGAQTGKITVSDGTSSFESPNFYVINNPSVAVNLTSTSQPICSTIDSAFFDGAPRGGNYYANYLNGASLGGGMIDSILILDSVSGYVNGVQNIVVYYDYTPLYTGIPAATASCPTITDSLLVEIRDTRLDSVVYTPISLTQASESLYNLTKLVYPLEAANYPSSYTGTYVLANNLLPSTVPSNGNNIVREAITYEINNSGCVNSTTDSIDLWPAPSLLDSIPLYLCSQDDTVFIQRNTDSLFVTYRGNVIYSSTLYRYQRNPNVIVGTGPDVIYTEEINSMIIRSTNGGVDSVNFLPPFEDYYFVPDNVVGNTTQLSLEFGYNRVTNYFTNGTLTNTTTTNYTIASVSKTFIIEDPSTVAINPALLADTIFCPINANNQLLGIPAGGQYYISGGNLGYQALANNIFNPLGALSPTLNTSYQLTYVYTGRACVDSAATGIFLPEQFSIDVLPNNGTGLYCETSPNDSIFFDLLTGVPGSIDTASAQFFVSGIQSGTIFSPTQVGPPGEYEVRYVVSDIYGCTEEATDTFTIFPIPRLAISALDPQYCFNDDSVTIYLYTIDTATNTTNEITSWLGGSVPALETASFTGNGIVGGGQYTSTSTALPYFYARTAGVGTHPIRYVYQDVNNCMDSINFDITVLPLPQVYMTTDSGASLDPVYCENDSIKLFGFPIGNHLTSGYGADSTTLFGVTTTIPTSLDSADTSFEPNIPGTQPGHLDEVIYYFFEDDDGCRDTARYSIRIRNFTTDPTIAGLQDTTVLGARCADDTELPVWANLNGGFDLDSLGWFTSDYTDAFSQLSDTLNTDSIAFYPDLTYIQFADRDVALTFHYTDTSRSCYNEVSDTVLIWALPYLTLSEQQVGSLNAMDLPGSKLADPPIDTLHHICETSSAIPIFAYNTTGVFNPFNGQVTIGTPGLITPDTGVYVMGRGIINNGGGTNIIYSYDPQPAGYGVDTIRYAYEDARGCRDTIDHIMVVDSLPDLSFIGVVAKDTTLNRHIYCENDTANLRVLPTPRGVRWTMTFNNQNVPVLPFFIRPDTLAVPGVYMDYEMRYDYTRHVYQSGDVCRKVLVDTVQIRPAPQLSWVLAPSSVCMSDSSERIPLSATPYGGSFVDATNNFQVVAGIIDTLFNPAAQAGRRDIFYYYLDTISGCDDTIQHTIYVYNQPRINFDITNGCSGRTIDFTPRTSPYGLLYNSVAIDSITQVIWNFGNGTGDTITHLPDTLIIPPTSTIYNGGGIFYPSLTVSNQGVCDSTFTRRIIVSPTVQPTDSIPYEEYFDNAANGWFQAPADTLSVNGIVTDSLWQWGEAIGSNIRTTGNNVWGTRLAHAPTTYRQGEHGWVYSPCFDLTQLKRPMIQLSMWKHTKAIVDGAILQYYDDSTNTWEVLGEYGRGINWYDSSFVVSSPGNQTTIPVGWSGESGTWRNSRYRLDNIGQDLRGRDNVRMRIAFASDPGTQLNLFDGIAFDSVKVGNRQRTVLLEHFSGVGYPGIGGIEKQLYKTIFNNLYGRDVNLIQYHIGNLYAVDNLYSIMGNQSEIDNRQRGIFYGVQGADLARVDGKLFGSTSQTSTLLSYPILETLDIEMLADPKFKIEFPDFPAVRITTSGMSAQIRLTALEDMPARDYSLQAIATIDSMTTNTGDTTMAVMLDMYPNNNGIVFPQRSWTAGDVVDTTVVFPNVTSALYDENLLGLVTFIQNTSDDVKVVYQSLATRNIDAFLGPVDSLDISVDKIEDHPGYEATQMNIFPNPTSQGFNVAFDDPLEEDYQWHVVSVSGQHMQSGDLRSGENNLYVSTDNLPAGVYIFILRNEHIYTQRRVVVRHP